MRKHEFINEAISFVNEVDNFIVILQKNLYIGLKDIENAFYRHGEDRSFSDFYRMLWYNVKRRIEIALTKYTQELIDRRFPERKRRVAKVRVYFATLRNNGSAGDGRINLSSRLLQSLLEGIANEAKHSVRSFMIQEGLMDKKTEVVPAGSYEKFMKNKNVYKKQRNVVGYLGSWLTLPGAEPYRPDSYQIRNSKLIDVFFHELTHIAQHMEQYNKKRRGTEYRSYLYPKDVFFKYMQDIRMGDTSVHANSVHSTSPQEIPARAIGAATKYIRRTIEWANKKPMKVHDFLSLDKETLVRIYDVLNPKSIEDATYRQYNVGSEVTRRTEIVNKLQVEYKNDNSVENLNKLNAAVRDRDFVIRRYKIFKRFMKIFSTEIESYRKKVQDRIRELENANT